MPVPTLLIFDLDGTLVDSMSDIHHSANLLLGEYGLAPLAAEQLRPCIGQGVRYLVATMLDAAGWGGGDVDAAVARYRALYAEHALDSTRPYPGVRDGLERLGHLPMAVISNKPAGATREILNALDLAQFFSHVAGGDSYPEMKPSPLPLRRIMKDAGADAADTWMIGDSVYDIEAGKAAGVRTMAVTWGFQPAETLKALKPDRVVSAFDEIVDMLR
jgi:phosphoglycolate phosphatase